MEFEEILTKLQVTKPELKKLMLNGQLREVFQITEWKKNCVYKTVSEGYEKGSWKDVPPEAGKIYAVPSMKLVKWLLEVN